MSAHPLTATSLRAPRVGFVGVGWIGRQRMCALARAAVVEPVVAVDPDPDARARAADDLPGIRTMGDIGELPVAELDGVVIATPSALHADQATVCLRRGLAVFCQKPLARDARETATVVDAARDADLLLGIDLSYRYLRASAVAHEAIARGDIGRPYAAELTFHNGYGPDKPWFASRRLAGGGCLMDLGTHLVDLALWLTDTQDATVDCARLLRQGRRLGAGGDPDEVEDLALAMLTTDAGLTVRLACSWWLPVGRDCAFACTVYGTDGAVSIENVGGSFYDFMATERHGTQARTLVEPPDDWSPRAIGAWASALGAGGRFDPAAEGLVTVARILDDIYSAA